MKQSLIATLVGSEKKVTIIQTQTMGPGVIYDISERGIKKNPIDKWNGQYSYKSDFL